MNRLSSLLLVAASVIPAQAGIWVPACAGMTRWAPTAACEPNTLSADELADGWILLFDGQTQFGWRSTSNADWQVRDGVITASQGTPGLLLTTSQFGNYVLKVDFRAAAGTNSGVFLRTSPKPDDLTTRCYELNIAGDDNPFPTGSFVRHKRALDVPDSTDWHTFEVTADDGHFQVKLDGKLVLDYDDPKPLGRGFIGLQFNHGKIEFRNVKLKPLGSKSLFNGKTLDGWKTYPEMQSTFSVTRDGWLRCVGGSGQLESEGRYADFTLQLEARVNREGANSGIFFRSIPGEKMNGYECQIHNGTVDGDRTQPDPTQGGTGAIFRRQIARKVVSDDLEWFALTIHADDKHMATWVDGYQVNDVTDTRPADEKTHNPRRGLSLEPGTIILQGHDAVTDVFFRGLSIAKLPER